jgi:hypothetical protein
MSVMARKLTRITRAQALDGFWLRLWLSDGSVVERDVSALLWGPVFERLRSDPEFFASARADHGTVAWPGDVDLCPDVLIWDGAPPRDVTERPAVRLVLRARRDPA